jgi:cobalt-zinc-cadmium efflux system protein
MQHEESGHNEHSHGGHGHRHAPKSFGAAFAAAAALNLGLVLAEFVFGFLSNSLALISEAPTIPPMYSASYWLGPDRG